MEHTIKPDNIYPGLQPKGKVFYQLPPHLLIEHALANKEGVLGTRGELICSSGEFKGRSPKDKFIVESEANRDKVWWGSVNQKITAQSFDKLHQAVNQYLSNQDLYIFDGFAGADKDYQLNVRIVTHKAWQSHFVNNMFIKPSTEQLTNFDPQFTILNACGLSADNWQELGLNSKVFVVIDLDKKLAVIGGTEYAGEMKKGIFSVMNYLLPFKNVMPMHCSATVGKKGDSAIYFGLSGTGKTTLSADPHRLLIGDDEHGWSEKGIFNFEGGCYAKTLKLDKEKEPDIWNAIRFGAILENVKFDEFSRVVDFYDGSITQNGRVSYPLNFINNIKEDAQAGHPNNIFMLTCDAFGVLPPVARLCPQQASYHFLSGYTAKVAGTETGVNEPQVTFSTCFGKPFMTQNPIVYSKLLADKMKKHHTTAYLINTGWVGGQKGRRISLKHTRAILDAILEGTADKAEYYTDKVFGFEIPKTLGQLGPDILNPEHYWADKDEYYKNYVQLAKMFIENFKNNHSYAAELVSSGPKLAAN